MAPKRNIKAMLSSELGDGDWNVQYNTKTGRPKRVRQKLEDSPFVDSAIAVSESEESDDAQGDEDVIAVSHRRKRKRRTRTPSPPLESSGSDDLESASDSGTDVYATRAGSRKTSAPPPAVVRASPDSFPRHSDAPALSFTIKDLVVNVPANHVGPITLQIEIPAAGLQSSKPAARSSHTRYAGQDSDTIEVSASKYHTTQSASTSSSGHARFAGFLDLPAELRNDIYERIFVDADPFTFRHPSNFQHSAAFLRTCRQVQQEGIGYLYSENKFIFERRTARHGSYWQSDWNEVGFKPMRKFLKSIGPLNLSLIRRASLQLEDAMPCLNPGMHSADDRRFVNDDTLMSCLRQLADHGRLQELELHFYGESWLHRCAVGC